MSRTEKADLLLEKLKADSAEYKELETKGYSFGKNAVISWAEDDWNYVIHTVGPIVYGQLNDRLCKDLRSCYENVLKCCLEHNIKSVAFCCISTGEFHFPNDKEAEIAWKTVTAFLEKHGDCMERVIFNVFKDSDLELYEKIIDSLQ